MSLMIYLAILLLGLILWIRGVIIVKRRNEVIKYAIVNAIIFITYSVFWFNHSQLFIGHDEYGLGTLFVFPLILTLHSIIFFIILLVTIKRVKQNYR